MFKGTNSTLLHLPGIFCPTGEQNCLFTLTHHEAAVLPLLEPLGHKRAQGSSQHKSLVLSALQGNGAKLRQNKYPMRDSKQIPLWQFFAILNQLEVFHHYCDSLQASNVHKAALCHCLNSYSICSSWKYTSHRTQTPAQRDHLCSKPFQILCEKCRCPTKHNSWEAEELL